RLSAQKISRKTRGFVANVPELASFEPGFDYLGLDVICTLSRHSGASPYFLDVLGLCGNGTAFTLADSDLRSAFPNEGRVILHPNSRLPVPKPGIAEAYKVEHFKTPRAIKVRAIGLGAKLLQVIYVPHASDRKDQVRQWLIDRSSASQAATIFVLADG